MMAEGSSGSFDTCLALNFIITEFPLTTQPLNLL